MDPKFPTVHCLPGGGPQPVGGDHAGDDGEDHVGQDAPAANIKHGGAGVTNIVDETELKGVKFITDLHMCVTYCSSVQNGIQAVEGYRGKSCKRNGKARWKENVLNVKISN